jgi:hypothetical protein
MVLREVRKPLSSRIVPDSYSTILRRIPWMALWNFNNGFMHWSAPEENLSDLSSRESFQRSVVWEELHVDGKRSVF